MQRFVRYAAVGGVATAAHYAVLVLCVRQAGWPAYVGSGLGAAVGAQLAFLGNRRFTFGHDGTVGAAWRRFQATAVLGALAGMAIVAAGVALGLHYLLAQVLATGVGLVLTFAVNRMWTFASGANATQ